MHVVVIKCFELCLCFWRWIPRSQEAAGPCEVLRCSIASLPPPLLAALHVWQPNPKVLCFLLPSVCLGSRGGSASVIRVANNKRDTVLYPSAARSISFRQLPASLSDKIQVYWVPRCAIRVGRNRSLHTPSLGRGAHCSGKQQKDAAGWRCFGLWAGGYGEGLEMDFTFWPDRASLILAPSSGTWSCKMNFLFNTENAKILH